MLPNQQKALRADCHGSGDGGEEGAHGIAAAASEVVGEDCFSGAVIALRSSDAGIAAPQFLKAARAGLRADRDESSNDREEDAHGLAAVASEVLDEDAFSGAVIVFRSSDPDIAAIVITFVQMAGSYAGQQCDHFVTIFRGEPPSGLANLFARHAPCLNDKNDVLTKVGQ